MRYTALLQMLFVCAVSLELPQRGLAQSDEPAAETEVTEENTAAESGETAEQPQPGATVRTFGRVLGAIFGGPRLQERAEEESELLGEPAPNFELTSVDGQTVRLEDLRGEVVVLDFWATWCGPCMSAMPEIQKVQEKFADQKVRIIGVNQGEELDDVTQMLEEKKFTFTQVLDSDSQVGDSFGVSGIPQTVVIDAEGVVQSVHVGYSPTLKATLTDQIEKLLRGEQLFDPAKVAEAQKRREERQADMLKKLALKNEDRFERLDEVLEDSEATLLDRDNDTQWFTIPGESTQTLMARIDDKRVALVRPGAPKAEIVEMRLPENASIWSCAPIFDGEELGWVIVGAKHDEDSAVENIVVTLCARDGGAVWTCDLPSLENDYAPDVFTVTSNLTGDASPEIAVAVSHTGLDEASGLFPGDSPRILTIFNLDGKQVLRTIVPGSRGVAMYVLSEADGNTLLMTTDEGLTRFRVKDE